MRTSSSRHEMHIAAARLFSFVHLLMHNKTVVYGALSDFRKFEDYADRMYLKLWKYKDEDAR